MTPHIDNTKATAQKIQDYFFVRGAVIKQEDWDWLKTTLLTLATTVREGTKAECVACVPDEQNMHAPWEHKVGYRDIADCDGCNSKSWNECREATLASLKSLKFQYERH